jgi:pyrimidine-nucleoside phosphorylase
VKTGSGAFLRKPEDAERLAALMVTTAEAAGTRAVALMTDMSQPLGRCAGNWIELAESVELLRGVRPAGSEALREPSLILAGWMIFLGGQAATPEMGYARAEAALDDGSALSVFLAMAAAQGGDISVFDNPAAFHKPGAILVLKSWDSGFISEMDTTKIGWAVQRGAKTPGSPATRGSQRAIFARRGGATGLRRWGGRQASRSIPTPALNSISAAARASRRASPSPRFMPPMNPCWLSRWSSDRK